MASSVNPEIPGITDLPLRGQLATIRDELDAITAGTADYANPTVKFLTSDSDQDFDVSTAENGTYRTGASWTATRTITFIGTPPDGAWFRISNNSGQEVTITNGTGNPLDIPLDPFNLEKGNTILFETYASTSKLIKTERAWETTSERIVQFGGKTGDFIGKVTADDFNYAWLDIDDLTADGSPDGAADYVMTYDATAGEHRKVLLNNLPGAAGTVSSVFGRTGSVVAVSGDYDDGEVSAAASATNYTPTASTVEGHLAGIDTALGAVGGGSGAYDLNGGTLTIDADGDSTLYESADDTIRLSTGGSDRLEIGVDRMVMLGGLDLDLDENYVRAYHTYKYNNVSGAQTLSRANYESGSTICHSGGAATYTVGSRNTSTTSESEQLIIRNRGSGTITLSASGVTIKGNTSIAQDESASLEWEYDGSSEYVWVEGGS